MTYRENNIGQTIDRLLSGLASAGRAKPIVVCLLAVAAAPPGH